MLCIAGIASQDRPIGKRPCHLAFVIQLSQLLRQVQEGFYGDHQHLGEALRVSACLVMHLLTFLFLERLGHCVAHFSQRRALLRSAWQVAMQQYWLSYLLLASCVKCQSSFV